MGSSTGSEHPALAHIGQRYRAEVEMDLIPELLPQIMGQATAPIAATASYLVK